MIRIVLATFALAFSSVAMAAPAADVGQLRAEAKTAKKEHKRVERFTRKWSKAADKDNTKKMARLDAKLMPYVRGELATLRSKGIESKLEPAKPIHPAAERLGLMPDPPEHPKLEERRDELVALRDMQSLFDSGAAKRKDLRQKSNLLQELNTTLLRRYLRKDSAFRSAKG